LSYKLTVNEVFPTKCQASLQNICPRGSSANAVFHKKLCSLLFLSENPFSFTSERPIFALVSAQTTSPFDPVHLPKQILHWQMDSVDVIADGGQCLSKIDSYRLWKP